jgi:choline monooxygenase
MPIDPVEHLVHNSVYRDEALFDRELNRLHGRVWSFVGHESEWPTDGFYRTLVIAGNPVVITRTAGELHAFYNVCRHRGAVVVEGAGTARVLRCPYHWWTFDLEGRLVGVPDRAAYECHGFETDHFGLRPITLSSVHGLVFATLDEDGPALEEFLGDRVVEVIGGVLQRADYEVAAIRSFPVAANWKLIAENARDGYHVPFVHPLFRSVSPPGRYELTDEGHAVQWTSIDESKLPDALTSSMDHTLPGLERGTGFFAFIFPDLIVMARNNFVMISTSEPLGLRETRVDRRVLGIVGDSEERRTCRLRAATAFALDSYADEDAPVLALQSKGLHNSGVPVSLLARGVAASSGTQGDDNRLRQWWATWRRYMELPSNASPEATAELASWTPTRRHGDPRPVRIGTASVSGQLPGVGAS